MIQSTLRTVEKVPLHGCLMLLEQESPQEASEQHDCLEVWAIALRQDSRIRKLEMYSIGFDFQDPQGVAEFVEALWCTRSTLS
mmetsp:Transcript_11076/g.16164  ORF Transcript_11076/g.16164 Transcript_11076/m.16164 type:complete len:83 (+) Transcript_11076:529-777(+)